MGRACFDGRESSGRLPGLISSMSRKLKPLREVLQRAVDVARLRRRTIEQALALPRGGWDDLVAGRRVLRVRHLLALARLLSVPPEDFLDAGLLDLRQRHPGAARQPGSPGRAP